MEDFSGAIDAYTRALVTDPGNPAATAGLASAKNSAASVPPPAHDSHDVQYYNEGMNFSRQQGDYVKALASFDQAISLDPGFADAWSGRAAALDKLGRYGEEIAAYDRVLAINPDDADAKNNREHALILQNQSLVTTAVLTEQSTPVTPVPQQTEQTTPSTPLLYAPTGALLVVAGIAVWNRRSPC